MFGLSSGSAMMVFKVVYTTCLFMSSIGYFRGKVVPAFWATTVIAVLTVAGLIASAMNWASQAPFDSVTDKDLEILTAIAAVLMLVSLSRPMSGLLRTTDAGLNSGANSSA